MKKLIEKWNNISLVKRIIVGLLIGIILALTIPSIGAAISIFGTLFVGALKLIAPLLVFFLVMTALPQFKEGKKTNMKSIVLLYILGTFVAGVVAVIGGFLFPVQLVLTESIENLTPPSGVGEVINTLLMNIVSNPISSIANANYIGILFWAVVLGLALKKSDEGTKKVIFMAAGENPYPLVIRCLKESGITAFFTRSSAANIPINMGLCKDFGLNKDTYSISIPLGATINMGEQL